MAAIRIVAIVLIGGLVLGLSPLVPGAVSSAAADCRCVYAGRYYNAGELACIKTANGPRLARCGQVSNLSSWKFTADRCGPSARRTLPAIKQTALQSFPAD